MPVSNDGMNVRIDDVIVEVRSVEKRFEDNAGHAHANGAIGIASDDLRRAQLLAHAIEFLEFARFTDKEQAIPKLLGLINDLAEYAESSTLEGDELPDYASGALELCDSLIRDPQED